MRQLWLKLGTLLFWLCWPALSVYLHRTHRTRVIVRAGGQILLVKSWLSDGCWKLPGGGLHYGEAPATGAVRELREEVGLEMLPERLVELATEVLDVRGLRFTCTYFLADIDKMGIVQEQRIEIADSQWLHISEIGSVGFQPDVRRALKLLVARGLF